MKRFVPRFGIALLHVSTAFTLPSTASRKPAWSIESLDSLVTLGDSYTDETRINYFGNHQGEPPPTAWVEPISNSTSTGGYVWARYLSWYTKAKLYNYATSGAVCSNRITPRIWGQTNQPFPSVLEYQIPAFTADAGYTDPSTKTPFLKIDPGQTLFAIWIGTNDLGNGAFLTNSQQRGKMLTNFVDCAFEVLDGVYKAGGRHVVLMNVVPLVLAPQYATLENGGVKSDKYWRDKPADLDGISQRMEKQVQYVNEDIRKRLIEACIKYPRSKFALFDTHALFTDIYKDPKKFLNGTAPPDVHGWVNHCDLTGMKCTEKASKDSYLWYDELHPSEQADRIVAREVVKTVGGRSEYAAYF